MSVWTVTAHAPATYKQVVKTLLQLAAESQEDFEFGPLDIYALQTEGLRLTSESDAAADTLRTMPGVSVEAV